VVDVFSLRAGTIIQADVPLAAHNPRPTLVVQAAETDGKILCIGISSKIPSVIPPHYIELPSRPVVGDELTSLTARCLAHCDWAFYLTASDIHYVRGRIKVSLFGPIKHQLQLLGKL
jgi:hypothetical protein